MQKPFFVRKDKKLKKVRPEDVVGLATEKNYTRIFLANRETIYMVRSTLSNALKKLPPDMFIKTRRSYAVSVFYIDNIQMDHLELPGELIPIGRQYYKSVMEKLNIIE
jgi:DNA-binding LytR/AlgR family response regulator